MPRARRSAATPSSKAAVALLLTFAAGFVDVVGYLRLYHVFTANMTGDTVHLAYHVAQLRWNDAKLPALVLAFFVTGSVLGRVAIEVGARNGVRSIASVTLVCEAALVGSVVALSTYWA